MANHQDGQHAVYSFLVHSSCSPDASMRFDSSTNAKQKRRRTSPHDHAILEAAYQKNSKPDKKERAEIVSQVDLGEKEVQIWFQNRRQNDRRKSKPLQPHELIAHLRHGLHTDAPPPDYHAHTSSELDPTPQSAPPCTLSGSVSSSSAAGSSIHELLNPPSASSAAVSDASQTNAASKSARTLLPGQTLTPPSSFNASQQELPASKSSSTSSTATLSDSSALARKRSYKVMDEDVTARPADVVAHEPIILPPLKKSSSFVRLAMTVDGAVKVRTNNEPTPSPPKQRLPPMKMNERNNKSLTRSQSDVQNTFVFKDVNPPIRRVGGAGFGRSRDARTWEFYCDRDSGDALETQAEAERNGSAIGAINLIRSSSQRNKGHMMSPNFTKQNVRRNPADLPSGKPKLSRARSSMARLQNFDDASKTLDISTKRPRHERSTSRDSDKENWAPGTRASHNPLRRMHPSAPRSTILQEHDADRRVPSADGQNLQTDGRLPIPETRASSNVSAHVGTPGKAKGDDLDCVQSLLSLSQGAWR